MGMMLALHPEQLNLHSDKISDICMQLGEFFQIQDDFLDCFGNTTVTGKIGTDIQDNKCSWLVVQALQKSNADQRQILHDNYGKNNTRQIGAVKELYDELDLRSAYESYQSHACKVKFWK